MLEEAFKARIQGLARIPNSNEVATGIPTGTPIDSIKTLLRQPLVSDCPVRRLLQRYSAFAN
eukprot:13468628-Heterocapsa_arctica.AAC.1